MELGGDTYGGRHYVVGSDRHKQILELGIKSDEEIEYEKKKAVLYAKKETLLELLSRANNI